jgi:guanosine-3',5'-bis(diphosphate) 3'-pyrophosphohydrolase
MKHSNKLATAICLASVAHNSQSRKFESTPYIGHLIEVQNILQHVGITDEETLAAGILHDVIEDTYITPDLLLEKVGHNITKLVLELTDDKTISKALRNVRSLEIVSTLSESAVNIKLADLLSNILAIPASWEDAVIAKYFEKCRSMITAIETQNTLVNSELMYLVKFALNTQTMGSGLTPFLYEQASEGTLYWSPIEESFIVAEKAYNMSGSELLVGTLIESPLNEFFQCRLLHFLHFTKAADKRIHVEYVVSEYTEDMALQKSVHVESCVPIELII